MLTSKEITDIQTEIEHTYLCDMLADDVAAVVGSLAVNLFLQIYDHFKKHIPGETKEVVLQIVEQFNKQIIMSFSDSVDIRENTEETRQ